MDNNEAQHEMDDNNERYRHYTERMEMWSRLTVMYRWLRNAHWLIAFFSIWEKPMWFILIMMVCGCVYGYLVDATERERHILADRFLDERRVFRP